jgi:hypothetical protein
MQRVRGEIMKTAWLLWRLWEEAGVPRRSLVCVCGSYAAAVVRTAGMDAYDIEEVQVQE